MRMASCTLLIWIYVLIYFYEKKFIGGIVLKESGQWYYNDSEEYEYTPGRLNSDWKLIRDVF